MNRQVDAINEAYFKKEVQPHVPDAWIVASKRDEKDQEIGIVGYEIPFNRHFYQYQPPRDLAEIDADFFRYLLWQSNSRTTGARIAVDT